MRITLLEFFNSNVRAVMRDYSISHFSTPTKTPWKASIAERVIRTLKTRLWRWFQYSKTNDWISVLSQFVENYNSTPHESIGMAPNSVNKDNQHQVRKRLFPEQAIKIDCSRQVGDLVRKLRTKSKFEKGFTPKWSEEVYIITKQFQSNGVCWYRLSEQNGKKLPGIYYSNQLNLVSSSPPLLNSDSLEGTPNVPPGDEEAPPKKTRNDEMTTTAAAAGASAAQEEEEQKPEKTRFAFQF